jgi:hypothetical protein
MLNTRKMIEDLQRQRRLIDQLLPLLVQLETGKARRGRPPAFLAEIKRRGRPPGSKNRPKELAA